MIQKSLYRIGVIGAIIAAFSTVFFFGKMRERAAYVHDLVRSISPEDRLDPSAAALSLSRIIYQRTNHTAKPEELDSFSRWESASFFNLTSAVSLRYGIYGIDGDGEPGGTMTRTLLNTLWAIDIPARKLQLLDNADGVGGGHTMVEFYDNGRWCVISPSDSSFVWRLEDGRFATAEEIRDDSTLYASVFDWKADYPYRFDRTSNIRWEKLPGPMRGLFRRVMGDARYESATTPQIYEKPRTLFMGMSFLAFLFFAIAAMIFRQSAV